VAGRRNRDGAIKTLPRAGGTVIVDNGIWLFDSDQEVPRGNFTLQGSSLNAQLIFTTGTLKIGAEGTNISNVKISVLMVDQSGADPNVLQAIQLWQCNGCVVSGNQFYGHSNGSVAVLIAFGGSNGRIVRNHFVSRAAGGSQLQINPLGNPLSSNSGFLVANNHFDSCGILLIGTNNIHVTQNGMVDQTLGNYLNLVWTAAAGGVTSGILIDYNVFDSTAGLNGMDVSGIPQDLGLRGTVKNITIDHNILRGSGPTIDANDFDPACLATCSDLDQTFNIKITNNLLDSPSGGSVINISGGTFGLVNGAVVTGNVMPNGAVVPNQILQDNHSLNVSISNNTL
jgi:hypothetical protein